MEGKQWREEGKGGKRLEEARSDGWRRRREEKRKRCEGWEDWEAEGKVLGVETRVRGKK